MIIKIRQRSPAPPSTDLLLKEDYRQSIQDPSQGFAHDSNHYRSLIKAKGNEEYPNHTLTQHGHFPTLPNTPYNRETNVDFDHNFLTLRNDEMGDVRVQECDYGNTITTNHIPVNYNAPDYFVLDKNLVNKDG